MSTPQQPGYGYPQQPYGQQFPPPPKQGMSTGKKVALGCGIPTVLGLILVAGCTAVVGKAADDVSKELDKNHDSAAVAPSGSAKAGDTSKVGEPDITKDVKVTACAVKTGDYDLKELEVKIDYTNSGDRRFSYLVEGEVLVNGEKKADLLSTASNLAPGQKYTDENAGALGYEIAKAAKSGDKIECKLLKVSRNSY
ncbi:DUF1720 domain-containing protein [Streptomyces sp. NPDC059989]|uniref:DUF1720 domain-containing protein n=1 Tax=Streptomyces sp. NPDC059989 TaxID=3347026 RepID=UPI00369F8ADE